MAFLIKRGQNVGPVRTYAVGHYTGDAKNFFTLPKSLIKKAHLLFITETRLLSIGLSFFDRI